MRGRTYRKRLRKRLLAFNLENDDLHALTKWMGKRGFKPTKKLKPKIFYESGRGLMSEETIKPGDVIISIPQNLLITPTSVLSSYLGNFFKRCYPKATGHEILSIFLMCERIKGEASQWRLYISSLPEKYSIPVYICHHSLNVLPKPLYAFAKLQCDLIKKSFIQLQLLFNELQSAFPAFKDVLNYELYKWAWSCVNTRCIFMECLENCSGKQCSYHLALAPFLDLLNHSVNVQVSAGFNKERNQYEVISFNGFKKYSQVFINYGCHDNQKLFLEYGFVINDNPNDFVPFFLGDILLSYKLCNLPFNELNSKIKYIKDNNLLRNAICSKDGISWNLRIILKILISKYNVKLWNALIQDPYNHHTDEEKFQKLKKSLLNIKVNEYTFNTPNINCSECSSHLHILSELCSILKSILIKAIS